MTAIERELLVDDITRRTVFAALSVIACAGAVPASAMAQGASPADGSIVPVSDKAPQMQALMATARAHGNVRVIVMLDMPSIGASIAAGGAPAVAAAKAKVAALQDAILARYFGTANAAGLVTAPQGFARNLTRFDLSPGFAISVTVAELQALAADARVVSLNPDLASPHS